MSFVLPLQAYDVYVGGIYYNLLGNEAMVTYGATTSNTYRYDVTIPETILYNNKTYTVTSIGDNAFSGCYDLRSIDIPNSVSNIGNNAFSGCDGLRSIDIPNGVSNIGNNAFSGCKDLNAIFISASVESIGKRAFIGCSSLSYIYVDYNNKVYDSRNDCKAIVETETNELIAGCKSTIIPTSVTRIGNDAFSGCNDLQNIDIPMNITSIGDSAFCGCKGLMSIILPNGVSTIGNYAFRGCNNLHSAVLPASITSIGEYAFNGCKELTDLVFSANISKICNGLFYNCSSLESFVIPPSVTSIGDYAFYGCKELTSIDIHSKINSIGEYAFKNCIGLTSVEIPISVTYIGDNPFWGCSGLASIEVNDNNNVYDSRDCCNAIIETETNSLIAGCKNTLISSSVTSIGYYAFSDCKDLTNICIPNSITQIGNHAFSGCSGLTIIEIPSSITCIESSTFNGCSSLLSILLPNSVNRIGGMAFKDCSSLINIKIPTGITSIEENTFYNCSSLRSIEIPSSVASIGRKAFSGCTAMTSVTNLSKIPQSIGLHTFSTYDTLHVLPKCKNTYENAEEWNKFTIIEDAVNFIIQDGEAYTRNENICASISYTRTFSNTHWQALYVPFAIPVDSLTEHGLQVAELNDTHQWDLDGDGAADSTRMEFFTLTTGSTEPNYPYLIKANETMDLTLKLEDVEVKATEEKSYECSSLKQRFTFVGTYTGVSGADMYSNNYYGMAGGGLKRVADATVSLKPQRWYMKIENKNGSPVSYYAPSIRFCVDGIEDESETTSIASMISGNREEGENIFSLDGIRQKTGFLKPGLYVHQGKKLVIR